MENKVTGSLFLEETAVTGDFMAVMDNTASPLVPVGTVIE
jgi:hypothetical protein